MATLSGEAIHAGVPTGSARGVPTGTASPGTGNASAEEAFVDLVLSPKGEKKQVHSNQFNESWIGNVTTYHNQTWSNNDLLSELFQTVSQLPLQWHQFTDMHCV